MTSIRHNTYLDAARTCILDVGWKRTTLTEVAPELLLPYLLDRRGRFQQVLVELLIPRIGAGQNAGTIRPGRPELLARTLLLTAHGLTLSAHTMADDGICEADLLADLADLITGGLQP